MTHVRLSETDEYKLAHSDQDIRGWEVRDSDDTPIGRVDDMIIDTKSERVDTILLDDGTELAAEDIYIGDDVVYLEASTSASARPLTDVHSDFGRVHRGRGTTL